MLKGVINLVFTWMNQGDIEGVIADNNEIVNSYDTDIKDWMSSIKNTGNTRKIKIQVFLLVLTKKGFRELIKGIIMVLREE